MNLAIRSLVGAPLTAGQHDANMYGVMSQILNVAKHSAPTDGVADARSAIAAADTAALGSSCVLLFPAGTYRIASDITISSMCIMGINAKLKPNSGVTVTFVQGFSAMYDQQHVLDISSGGTFTAQAMPEGYVTPHFFGAKADAVNNDSPGIEAACMFGSLGVGGHASFEVRYPAPRIAGLWYRLEQTVYAGRCVHHKGMVPAHTRGTGLIHLRPVSGLKAAMVMMGSYSSSVAQTEHVPSNPIHSDPWVVYETQTTTSNVNLYVCKLAHTASAANRPGQGTTAAPTNSWPTYWTEYVAGGAQGVGDATLHGPAWAVSTAYKTSPGLGRVMLSSGSEMSGLFFEPLVAGTVKFGVVHTCIANFTDCGAANFEQAGFAGRGQSNLGYTPLHNLYLDELSIFADIGTSNSPSDFPRIYSGSGPVQGGVNMSTYTRCTAVGSTNGHGFYCEGNVAGIVKYDACDAQGNAGSGFCDNTSVGSNYLNGHSAQNSLRVFHPGTGLRYMCIKGHHASQADAEPGTGANWRTYWYLAGGTISDGTWSSGTYYNPCGAINVCDLSNGYANIINHYSEGGIEKGVVGRAKTQLFGGLAATNERVIYQHPEFWTGHVVRGNGDSIGSFGHTNIRDPYGTPSENGFWVGAWSTLGGWQGSVIYTFGDALDAGRALTEVSLSYNTTDHWYQWVKDENNEVINYITGKLFNMNGYSGVTVDGTMGFPRGFFIGGDHSTGLDLIRFESVNAGTLAEALTALNARPAVRGQRWYFSKPNAGGKEGVVCITPGSVGTTAALKEFGAIAA